MIDETYAVFAEWDFGSSKKEHLDRLKRENFIGDSTTTWLRDIAKVLTDDSIRLFVIARWYFSQRMVVRSKNGRYFSFGI